MESRRKAENKVNELWAKLSDEQTLRSQLTQNVQSSNDRITNLEKQLSILSEKFKNEADSNLKLKKNNAELSSSCENKEKQLDLLNQEMKNIASNHVQEINNLKNQLESSWAQISSLIKDLDCKCTSLLRCNVNSFLFLFAQLKSNLIKLNWIKFEKKKA